MEENLRAVDAKKRAELEHKKTYRTDDFEKYHQEVAKEREVMKEREHQVKEYVKSELRQQAELDHKLKQDESNYHKDQFQKSTGFQFECYSRDQQIAEQKKQTGNYL